MSEKPVVLLVGMTGMLGSQIADAVLNDGRASLRALIRDPESKAKELQPFVDRGVEIVRGDVGDMPSLLRATEGVDAVVSSLNNEPALIVDGQTHLLRASEQNGVRRFIPSDFSADFRSLSYGDNDNFDMRLRFHEVLGAGSPVAFTSVLNGGFTEMLLQPGFGPYNAETATLQYWEDPDQLLDYTTVADTAKYVAACLFDPRAENQYLEVAGDQISAKGLADVYSELTGRPSKLEKLGSADDLRAKVAEIKPKAKQPWDFLPYQYMWTMATGKAKLRDVRNDWYPGIQPMRVKEFLATKL